MISGLLCFQATNDSSDGSKRSHQANSELLGRFPVDRMSDSFEDFEARSREAIQQLMLIGLAEYQIVVSPENRDRA